MHTAKILLGALLVAASASSYAVNTVDLKVIGTIVPSACVPVFTGGDTIDYGDIGAGTLSDTDFTALPPKSSSVTLTCDEATTAAITFSDMRTGSTPTGIGAFLSTAVGIPGIPDGFGFGLGLVGAKEVGAYVISFPVAAGTGDGTSVDTIGSDNLGATWYAGSTLVDPAIVRYHSWAATGTIVPAAHTVFVQPFNVTTAINKKADLPALTNAVPLNGLATLTVIYP